MQKINQILSCLFLLFLPGLLPAQDVPVDLTTGAPTVSIPLYTAVNGDVSAPVGLSYSANGMKVSKYQQSGNAGIGWSLYGGGSIVRELRGLPDDYAGSSTDARRGWFYSTLPADLLSFAPTVNATCTAENTNFTKLDNWFTTLADTEPDVFYFQCGSHSGKFMLDNNKQWQVIPYQDVRVSFDMTSKNITLTTGDGMTYSFDLKTNTSQQSFLVSGVSAVNYLRTEYELYKNKLQYVSSWHLRETLSSSGKKITYGYSSDGYGSSESIQVRLAEYGSAPAIKAEYRMEYNVSNIYKLAWIRADQTEVKFTWGSKYISQIAIYNFANKVNSLLKEYNFEYKGSSSLGTGYLRKVVEQSGSCVVMPPYVFDYYGADLAGTGASLLPLNNSFKKDYWGYYNEKTTSEVPTLYVYNDRNDGERIRIEPIPGVAPSATLGVTGNSRRTNPATVAAGMLDKVTYPGGGHMTYAYEAGDYYDAAAAASFTGGGVRVKQVRIHDGQSFENDMVHELDYKQANGHSSGRLLYSPSFAITTGNTIVASLDDMAPEKGILYGRVGVRSPGAGKAVYESDMEAAYPASTDKTTISSYARSSLCPALGNIKAGYYTYPYPLNGDYSYQRGQVKKVLYYDEADLATATPLPLKEEEYTYLNLTHGSPTTIKGLKFERVGDIYVYGLYSIKARDSKVLSQQTVRIANQVDKTKKLTTTTTYTYGGGGRQQTAEPDPDDRQRGEGAQGQGEVLRGLYWRRHQPRLGQAHGRGLEEDEGQGHPEHPH
jgi:hypothetical protein